LSAPPVVGVFDPRGGPGGPPSHRPASEVPKRAWRMIFSGPSSRPMPRTLSWPIRSTPTPYSWYDYPVLVLGMAVRCLSRRQTRCNAPDPVHLDGRTRVQNRRSEHVGALGDTAGRGLLIRRFWVRVPGGSHEGPSRERLGPSTFNRYFPVIGSFWAMFGARIERHTEFVYLDHQCRSTRCSARVRRRSEWSAGPFVESGSWNVMLLS
jgi:hypothetical protein